MALSSQSIESIRLNEDSNRLKNWKRWGPYLSERQWSTVREDYSEDGSCWEYFPHEHARSRAYRWGEDGLLGICDRQARLCFSMALWNGQDHILKERLFGLTGKEGNHGEDVKECYFYLDSTPTHSYMKALYKYPQSKFPYEELVKENGKRSRTDPEYELLDTGIFKEGYWDAVVEYAKESPNSMAVKMSITNRGRNPASIHVIPTFWFRNTWSWGCSHEGCTLKPEMASIDRKAIRCHHQTLPSYTCVVDDVSEDWSGARAEPNWLFTDNDTNYSQLFGSENHSKFVKDAFHRFIIKGERDAVNKNMKGTKAGAWLIIHDVPVNGTAVVRSRIYQQDEKPHQDFGSDFEDLIACRKLEADEFYDTILPAGLDDEEKMIARQASAGLLWSKQFYHYIVRDWLGGDQFQPRPPTSRLQGRNSDWRHLFNKDVISVPDKWEYPWYASWDLAFHMIPFCHLDPDFAQQQLVLLLREWYMHPNGQIPAYEFALGDVNPPVHAWAVMNVFQHTKDVKFLTRCFHKLMLNFTWWVNRKDPQGRNIYSGGFLGLDNIGVFDRSKPLPVAGDLEQADGTAWMAFFCVTMLDIALILAERDDTYEDMASKFLEHLIYIMDAINNVGQGGGLWHEEDGFYYDFIRTNGGFSIPLRIRSMVGLVPLFACLVLDENRLKRFPEFEKRTRWFMLNRKDLVEQVTSTGRDSIENILLLAIPSADKLCRLLHYLLDEQEFLSPFGIRSLSKIHEVEPFVLNLNNETYRVEYIPGESNSDLFGGNSNWRGPIWFPMNFLIIQSLKRYHLFYGETFQVDCPTRSNVKMNLKEIASFLSQRLCAIFKTNETGRRPCHGKFMEYLTDVEWKNLLLFYEYFNGNDGKGCGASHQTGWTALVFNFILDKNAV